MRNYIYSSVLLTLLLALAGCDSQDDSLEPEDRFVKVQVQPDEAESAEDAPVEKSEFEETVAAEKDEPGSDGITHVDGSKIQALGNLDGDSGGKAAGEEGSFGADKKLAMNGERSGLVDALSSGGGKTTMDEVFKNSRGAKTGASSPATGGMGMRGIGRGGGGEGFGRIGGLGKVGTGYGRGSASLGAKRSRKVPRIRMGSAQVRGHYPEPAGTEDYTSYGTNKFTDPSKDAKSTFAIDVDTGAYTIARRKLNSGTLPPAASVRVEEFINYFGYSYPAPKNDAFAVSLEGAPSPFSAEKNRYVMRVGVQGKTLTDADRKPVHLTFLVDVSGSMSRPDKLGLAKRSLKYLTKRLKQHDTVAISTYAGNVKKVLDPTGMEHRGKILGAIDGLNSAGSTAMNDGLQLAYRLAMKSFEPGHVNRVIVMSDGDANVGPVSHEELLKRIKSQVDEGVTLSTIGFGMGNYKDTLMEQLANKGNGNYYYIDSMKEAQKIFGEQLDGTLQVIAKDVKIQVEFDPDKVSKYRLIGYENRDIADKDFRNDKIDAGEIGAGHRVTALYEVELKQPQAQKIATVRIRHKKPTADTATEREFYFGASDIAKTVGMASKDFQWATAVAGFAELLRKSPYSKQLSWDLVLEVAQASTRGKKDRNEMIGLIKKARKIAG